MSAPRSIRSIRSQNTGDAAERHAWLKMAFSSQLVALGLQVSFIQYDLIVLEKT